MGSISALPDILILGSGEAIDILPAICTSGSIVDVNVLRLTISLIPSNLDDYLDCNLFL